MHCNVNPTLHGFLKVAVYMGGGALLPPLENDSRDHFWGQIDLCPKKYAKLGLEVVKKKLNGCPKKQK